MEEERQLWQGRLWKIHMRADQAGQEAARRKHVYTSFLATVDAKRKNMRSRGSTFEDIGMRSVPQNTMLLEKDCKPNFPIVASEGEMPMHEENNPPLC